MACLLLLVVPLADAALRGRDYGSARVLRIVKVYDGDTFRADVEGWPAIVGDGISVRIAGIDTPEMRGSPQEVRELATAARDFAAQQLYGAQAVELRHIRRGKYFRVVAVVIVDGTDLGAVMLARGLAKPYDGGRRPAWP